MPKTKNEKRAISAKISPHKKEHCFKSFTIIVSQKLKKIMGLKEEIKMSKKALLSLALIGILAFGLGMGSYAWFTSQATSTDNVFETGTLIIEEDETVQQILSVENIYPSWESSPQTITVNNDGSLAFKYRMSVSASDSILYTGSTPLQVKVNNGDYVNIDELGYVELGQIPADSTGTFTIQFRLPQEANNDYQGVTGNFTFVFDATQIENPGWDQ